MRQKKVVFVGNCQANSLLHVYRAFVGGPDGLETAVVDDTALDRAGVAAAVQDADVVVAQQREFNETVGPDVLRPGVELHRFPMVLQAYLWPYAHEPHVRNGPEPPLPDGPYPGQLSDSFLNRLITRGVEAREALALYREHDIAKAAHLDRLYELHMDQQRERDARTGFDIASLMEAGFRTEALFMSPHHPNRRLFGVLLAQLFACMGVDGEVTTAAVKSMLSSPFPSGELPLHPGVIAHFGLGFADDQTRYAFHGEGRFTFDEYVLRYMAYEHNHDLRAGAYLVHGGDVAGGIAHLERGLQRSPTADQGWRKLGLAHHFLGRGEAAVEAYRRATELAPDDPEAWRDLADGLLHAGRPGEAAEAGRRAVALAPDFGGAHLLLVHALDRVGDRPGAAQAAADALRLLPGQLEPMVWAAITRLLCGDEAGATALAEQTRVRHPRAAGGHNVLAEVHEAHGRRAQAIAVLDACVAGACPDAQTYSLLGNYHLRSGDLAPALVAFEAGLQIEPGRPDLQAQAHEAREGLRLRA